MRRTASSAMMLAGGLLVLLGYAAAFTTPGAIAAYLGQALAVGAWLLAPSWRRAGVAAGIVTLFFYALILAALAFEALTSRLRSRPA